MLDIKFIRENPDLAKKELAKKRVPEETITALLDLDQKRRALTTEAENLKASRNKANDEIAKAKREGKNSEALLTEMKTVSQKIGDFNRQVGEIDEKIAKIVHIIPNMPHESVPSGNPPEGNKTVREWGKTPQFSFTPKDHLELAAKSGWISFERATKLSGSGFALFQGEGARLVRALMNFMIDFHTKKHGYKEVWPPALVNRQSMFGTGQLPKMEEDMYKLADDDLFLIPTAEVPITNIHRDDVLDEKDLPIKYTGYSPCFRREAGSYGKDTKGLSRVHQFDKVEMVQFVKPEDSLNALETLVKEAEDILQALEIPYRVVLLCSGDLSFSAAKCYDLEAFAPGTNKWFEVSSCSTFLDFQARRMNIKYKSVHGKTHLVHTLNGSGVAFARTIICLLENHQRANGSVKFPKALEPYLGTVLPNC